MCEGIRLKRDCYIEWCNRFGVPVCIARPWKNNLPVIIDDNFSYDVDIKNKGEVVHINLGNIKINEA